MRKDFVTSLLIVVLISSCKKEIKTNTDDRFSLKTKKEHITNENNDSVLIKNKAVSIVYSGSLSKIIENGSESYFLDLSGKGLTEIPYLSILEITGLDLSHNNIEKIEIDRLPKKLKKLNLSYNQLKGYLYISDLQLTELKELDMSFNKLDTIKIYTNPKRLNVRNNNLKMLMVNHIPLEYLNTLKNKELNHIVGFYPKYIDTIISDRPFLWYLDAGRRVIDDEPWVE